MPDLQFAIETRDSPMEKAIRAALIACTMAGAVVTDLFVLHFGLAATIRFTLLAFAAGVAAQEWSRT